MQLFAWYLNDVGTNGSHRASISDLILVQVN
jgi:hypothetical protein